MAKKKSIYQQVKKSGKVKGLSLQILHYLDRFAPLSVRDLKTYTAYDTDNPRSVSKRLTDLKKAGLVVNDNGGWSLAEEFKPELLKIARKARSGRRTASPEEVASVLEKVMKEHAPSMEALHQSELKDQIYFVDTSAPAVTIILPEPSQEAIEAAMEAHTPSAESLHQPELADYSIGDTAACILNYWSHPNHLSYYTTKQQKALDLTADQPAAQRTEPLTLEDVALPHSLEESQLKLDLINFLVAERTRLENRSWVWYSFTSARKIHENTNQILQITTLIERLQE